ncbi:MAG: hypothetical protein R3F20_06775 [Planctomycetota bacterium]
MPDERRSAIREGVRPALLMGEITPDARERLALAGVAVDDERIFPHGSSLGEISAALEDAPVAVELGAALDVRGASWPRSRAAAR